MDIAIPRAGRQVSRVLIPRRMRPPPTLLLTCSALLPLACGSSTEPRVQPTATLSICPATRLALNASWMAYRNEGGAWKAIGSDQTQIAVTQKVGVAIAVVPDNVHLGPALSIWYVSAIQAQKMLGCGVAWTGTKNLSGGVTGLLADTAAFITSGNTGGSIATATVPTFTLADVRDGPVDILAGRRHDVHSSFGTYYDTDRMIVRANQNLPSRTSMPVLDFSSPEAFALESSAVTFSGISGGPYHIGQLGNELYTPSGEYLSLSFSYVDSGSVTALVHSVPAERQWVPVIQRVWLHEFADSADVSVQGFYRNARDRTLDFPPLPVAPQFRDSVGAPYRRVQMLLAAQPQYDAAVQVFMRFNDYNSVLLYGTREYFGGTPTEWSLVVPDLTGAAGFSAAWAPAAGSFTWTLNVSNRGRDWLPNEAKDGDAVNFATLTGAQH